MAHRLIKMIEQSWQQPNWLTVVLWPLSLLYRFLFSIKKAGYRLGLSKTYRAPVPVLVVGNLTVGGTGKTPLVIYLVEQLRIMGFKPGVISRGYAGDGSYPLIVSESTAVSDCGDEPALIVKRTAVPMVVGPNRQSDIKLLLQAFDVDIVISDDGLQHFALARDIEICVVDKTRSNNNHCLLPAGPFREATSRLATVDLVVQHVTQQPDSPLGLNNNHAMSLYATEPVALANQTSTHAFDTSKGVHAVAGIGNPQRFFTTCSQHGWQIQEHAFADHYSYSESDLDFADSKPILMTEKDAVKCQDFSSERLWYLPVDAKLSEAFAEQLETLLITAQKAVNGCN